LIKKILPVGGPLAIHVMLAMLTRACGGEDDEVRMPRQGVDQGSGMRFVEMFGHLQAQHGIEALAQIPRLGEILRAKTIRRDQQLIGGSLDAINAHVIRDASFGGGVKPGSGAATHIQEVGGDFIRKENRQHRFRPLPGMPI
jgi:hypothetical protein